MPAALLTSRGIPLRLGRELGHGGEGAVFEVHGLSGRAAKLYHRCPDASKQAKLRYMAGCADRRLLSCTAWPEDTVHGTTGGPAVGYLMRQVEGGDSIHVLYSPAQRRQERPEVRWDFLLQVARNLAGAFAVLHAQGHVLGDVNQGNVVVCDDGRVMLIDCDSFQVNAHGRLHRCEVGVSHFTPPELQGLASFDACVRTANHDNFGLALLIFHLLFGGRHPFAGVPLRAGVGEALEHDIRALRYAYARDAARRGLAPPPRALPPSLVSAALERMFHRAFTEEGAAGRRPAAGEWMVALEALHAALRRCQATAMHVFPAHLGRCPWCELERQGVLHFVDLHAARARTQQVVHEVRTRIDALRPPAPVRVPCIDAARLQPQLLPLGVPGADRLFLYRALALSCAGGLVGVVPQGWFFVLVASVLAWALATSFVEEPRRRERRRRLARLAQARRDHDALVAAIASAAGPGGFVARRDRLVRLCEACHSTMQAEQDGIERLGRTRLSREQVPILQRRARARCAARRVAMQAELLARLDELQQFARLAESRAAAGRTALEVTARRVAQAERDLTVV